MCIRDRLEGVFEVHSVAVLGVSSVLNDGSFQMRSCTKCKAIVHTEFFEEKGGGGRE